MTAPIIKLSQLAQAATLTGTEAPGSLFVRR